MLAHTTPDRPIAAGDTVPLSSSFAQSTDFVRLLLSSPSKQAPTVHDVSGSMPSNSFVEVGTRVPTQRLTMKHATDQFGQETDEKVVAFIDL